MWQRFSERARKAVFFAQEEAQLFGEGYVSTEHLLLGILREPDNTACVALQRLNVTPKAVREEVEKHLPRGEVLRSISDMVLTPRAKRVIDLAYDTARDLNHNYIGTEHLLLGLIREGGGLAGRVLDKLGVTFNEAQTQVIAVLKERGTESSPGSSLQPGGFIEGIRKLVTRTYAPEPIAGFFLFARQGRFLPEVLALVMLADAHPPLRLTLQKVGLDEDKLRSQIEQHVLSGLTSQGESVTPGRLSSLLQSAHAEAERLGRPLSSEMLLLALIRHGDNELARALAEQSVTIEMIEEALEPPQQQDNG